MWNDLKRYAAAPEKLLLWEALLALVIARIAMFCLPFRWIASWLGTPGAETPLPATDAEIRQAKDIGRAIGVLAKRVPWDGRCLAQALAASGMLRRRGLEGTVSFGAGRDDAGKFSAHAWLRMGPYMVTGGPGHERFKTFTTFARRRM